jgi:hypothetical protein
MGFFLINDCSTHHYADYRLIPARFLKNSIKISTLKETTASTSAME